ncbi:MAG: membrane dipeptidase, partial [Oscillospiraceae bacterium]|nr:membrane dipeptidase [Oscillospiraceae bacterium]
MIADAHLDLCYDLLRRRQRGERGSLAGAYLPRWRRAGVGLVVAAVYVDTLEREEDYYAQAMQQLDALRGELAGVEGDVALCT